MDPEFIDTTEALQGFIAALPSCDDKWPSLYIDLEGNDLCRQGTLSLLTILVEPTKIVHIIDINKLGSSAFTTSSDSRSLKSILESEEIKKVFFDIRNDSDALFSHFGIHVAGIEDLQLFELASRRSSKRLVHGLAKCIENDANLGYQERRQWRETKEQGRRLFAPEVGGSYAVLDQRPLPTNIMKYCAQDVNLLPGLRDVYLARLCDAQWERIEQETVGRIALSQSPGYNGKGKHMAQGPPAWLTWNPPSPEGQSRKMIEERRKKTSPMPSEPNIFQAPTVGRATISITEAPSLVRPGPSHATALPGRGRGRGRGTVSHVDMSRLTCSLDQAELDDEYDDQGRDDYWDRGYDSHDSDQGTGPDLTACDKECGYCGRCMY